MSRYRVTKAFDGNGESYKPGDAVDTREWPRDNLYALIRGNYLVPAGPAVEIDGDHLAAFQAALDGYAQQAAEAAVAIAALIERLDAVEAKQAETDERIAALIERLDAVEAKQAETDERIAALESELTKPAPEAVTSDTAPEAGKPVAGKKKD